jgi:hypothetical protein
MLEQPTRLAAQSTPFPTFRTLSSKTPVAGSTALVSNETPSSGADILPNGTPQVPVSGGATATETEASPDSTEPTQTVRAVSNCTPAVTPQLDAVWQVVEDADPDNEVVSGWMIQSNEVPDLWLVGAKIHGPAIEGGVTSPGVWGVFLYTQENFDIYAINDIAMQYSYSGWGEDSDPVLSMQTGGASEVYNCAVRGD